MLAYTIGAVVTLSYLALYTAYHKQKKTLSWDLLADVIFVRRGWDWTLVELNKVISLAGLTLILLSFLPYVVFSGSAFVWTAHSLLTIHSIYSVYKFYGFSLQRLASDKPMKQLSIFLGAVAQGILWAREYGYISGYYLVYGTILFGLGHFWTMEIDYKYRLQVRPFAYLPFILGALVLLSRNIS
mmetsp:Transcript_19955/g.28680  ORF Transcript_19955/g.28680 Transcript_19955/m.28680 type:complete len:185 (+) Transcript_19955:74-628(+)